MPVPAFLNQKGGVERTTLATNVATASLSMQINEAARSTGQQRSKSNCFFLS
jgi:hypothetical protein